MHARCLSSLFLLLCGHPWSTAFTPPALSSKIRVHPLAPFRTSNINIHCRQRHDRQRTSLAAGATENNNERESNALDLSLGQVSDALDLSLGQVLPLAGKMVGGMVVILAVKVVKDALHYPPMFLDRILLQAQQGRTNEVVMLCKFMAVILFKGIHDTLYYPSRWSKDLMQSETREEMETKIAWCCIIMAASLSQAIY